MSRTRPPHDALFKAAFSELGSLIGELRAMLPSGVVDAFDFSKAELVSGSFVDEELRARHTDILWSLRFRGRDALLYVLLEHQSSPDPLMPFRLLCYMVRIWERWLRMTPDATRLPAVIPVVVFQGPGAWQASRQFSELIDLPSEALAALGPYLPSFELLLDELGEQSESEIRSRSAPPMGLATLLLLRSARESADMLALLSSMVDLLGELDAEPRDLEALFRYTLLVGEVPVEDLRQFIVSKVGQQAAEVVMTTGERLLQQGREEGLAQGLEKGRRDLLLRQVQLRFGVLSPHQLEFVHRASVLELERGAERILTAASFDDLFAGPE